MTIKEFRKKLEDSTYTISEGKNKALIDFITDDFVYISMWNKTLSNYERICFTLKEVKERVEKWERVLISDKVEITLQLLKQKRENKFGFEILIKEIDEIKDDDKILKWELEYWDVLYSNRNKDAKFIDMVNKKSKRYILTSNVHQDYSANEKKNALGNTNRYSWSFKESHEKLSLNKYDTKKLKEVILETLGVKQKDVSITDLPKKKK